MPFNAARITSQMENLKGGGAVRGAVHYMREESKKLGYIEGVLTVGNPDFSP